MTDNLIIHKKSAVSGKVPTSDQLEYGELAINYNDGLVYIKKLDGSIKQIGDDLPDDVVQDSEYVHTDNNFSDALKAKLDGIDPGAGDNVQADWSVTDTNSDAYILNKPVLSVVATTGDYSDLINRPVIPVQYSDSDVDFHLNRSSAGNGQVLSWSGTDYDWVNISGGGGTVTSIAVDVPEGFQVSGSPITTNGTIIIDYETGYVGYTLAEQTKVATVEAGAQPNVQSDWNVVDSGSDAYIKNKPVLLSQFVNDSNFISSASQQALHPVDAFEFSGDTLTLRKANGTSESVNLSTLGGGVVVSVDGYTGVIDLSNDYQPLDPNIVSDEFYVHTDNNYTAAEKLKLAAIEAGAEVNVQGDWNETDTGADSFIKNKPTALSDFDNDENFISSDSAQALHATNAFELTGNTLSIIRADNTTESVDLSLYLDDTNLSRITTGVYVAEEQVLRFTRDDASTFDIDASMFFDDTNLVTSVDGQTGAVDLSAVYQPLDANIVSDAFYVHTDNNYTTVEKTKLSGIEAGAEVNVQVDWNETETTSDAYIKNKPVLFDQNDLDAHINVSTATGSQVLTWSGTDYTWETPTVGTVTSVALAVPTGLTVSGSPITSSGTLTVAYDTGYVGYTTAEQTKLSGIASGAEVNVQADWNEADVGSDAYILNKPAIPPEYNNDDFDAHINVSTATSGQFLNWNGTDYAWSDVTVGTVTSISATVPTGFIVTGSPITTSGTLAITYDAGYVGYTTAEQTKLSGIASGAEVNVQADWNVVDTGSDAFIQNKPTAVSSFTNDANYITTTSSQALHATDAISLAANILTLTKADNTTETVDLSLYLDDTNLARIISGVYVAETQVLRFTRDDDSTFDVDASMFFDDTNLVTSVDGQTGAVDLSAVYQALDANIVSDAFYVHTDNNYTTAEQTKLSGIASGAEVNVQADWNETNTASDAYIQNKPSIPTQYANSDVDAHINVSTATSNQLLSWNGTDYAWVDDQINPGTVTSVALAVPTGLTVSGSPITSNGTLTVAYDTGYVGYTTAEQTKLSGIATGAEVNVQADWDVTDTADDAFIKNKPTIPTQYTNSDVDAHVNLSSATTGQILSWNGTDYAWVGATDGSVTSVALAVPTGLTVSGSPITSSGTLTVAYDTGYVGYTTAEQTKLSGIATGAEVNVQADWDETNTASDAYIQNKPSIPTQYANSDVDTHLNVTGAATGDVLSWNGTDYAWTDVTDGTVTSVALAVPTGLTVSGSPITTNGTLTVAYDTGYVGYTTAEQTKLSGIASGAEVNVQADWNETEPSSDAYILNKPALPTQYTNDDVDTHINVSAANSNQLLSWNGTDYAWVDDQSNPGTVTSVDITVPTGLTVSGSPITSSGTIAISYDTGYVGYTTTEQTKLSGIAAGAEVNVQADWNESNTASDAYIQNKPTAVSSFTNDANYLTPTSNQALSTTNTLTISGSVLTLLRADATESSVDLVDLLDNTNLPRITSGSFVSETEVLRFTRDDASSFDVDVSALLDDTNLVTSVDGQTGAIDLSLAYQAYDVNIVSDALYVRTEESFTTVEKNKLSGIEAGAEVNVQADWNETETTSDAYIKNKPSIYQDSDVDAHLNTSTAETDQVLSWNGTDYAWASGAIGSVTSVALAVPTGLTVSGSPITSSGTLTVAYDTGYVGYTTAEQTKLSGIAAGAEVNVQADWNEANTASDAYIQNKPTIPTVVTYDLSVLAGTATSSIVRLAGSDATNDDVTIQVGQVDTTDGLTITESGNTITLSHANTSSSANLTASGRTYVTGLTFDTYGHVTGYTTGTETVTDTDTDTTYTIDAVDSTNDAIIRLVAGGDGAGTDDIKLIAGINITIDVNETTDEITINSSYTDTNTNQLTTFQVEDGDGTEVTISHAKEWKFVEGTGDGATININWTDTDPGSDADPFDLAFAVTNTDKGSAQSIFKNIAVTDTDSGYSWAETGTVVADNNNDTITLVSGANVDIDVDATNDAIRITASYSETDTLDSVTSRGNTTTNNISVGNITTSGYLRGPASFTIDPAAHGDDTGTVVIAGNLQVDGTTTTVNSTVVEIDDLNITLAAAATTPAEANGAGITIAGASASMTYNGTNDDITFNKTIVIDAGESTTLDVKCDDAGRAMLRLYGDAQGTGIVEVGQSTIYGGGIFYNGDGTPAFASGETVDRISFYRRTNGSNTVVFEYPHDSSTVTFKAVPTVNGDSIARLIDLPTDTDTTYTIEAVDSTNDAIIRLVAGGDGSGTDDIKLVAGTNVTIDVNETTDEITISSSYTDTNTNQLTTFQVEDGDGTEVTISHAKEWKFVEGTGDGATININWTDTDPGSDADPFDLTFAVTNTDKGSSQSIFKNVTVTDADSGYTWAETGSVVADTNNDTITLVSGANIDIDVDATSDAIRITSTFAESDTLESVTGRGNTTTNDIVIKDTTNSMTVGSGEVIASTTTTQQVLHSVAASTYTSGKFMVQVEDTVTGDRQVSELLWLHDGTDTHVTQYGLIRTSAANLAQISVILNGANVELVATQASSNDTDYTVGVISLHTKGA